jgi:monoterpene epsilon-lactone hydrolase
MAHICHAFCLWYDYRYIGTIKGSSMPSSEILAFNEDARTRKSVLSSAYDPAAMRQALLGDDGAGDAPRIERRGNPDAERLVLAVAGGGFFLPPGEQHRALMDRLCERLGAQAAILHHRLSPEHPFPAAYDDVVSGLASAFAFEGVRRVDVVADSSGAALALSALLARRDLGLPLPISCVLISALTDMAMTGLSHVANSEADPMFGPGAIIHKAWHYLKGANPTDPRASPYWGDLARLPRMLMFVGSTEIMLDDTLRFARKVEAAGGTVKAEVYEDAPHDFPLIPHLPEAQAALEEMIHFLSED